MKKNKEEQQLSYVNIVAKVLVVLCLVLAINLCFLVLFISRGMLETAILVAVFVEIGIILGVILHKMILHPLFKLWQSLECINFDRDIIDFTKVDSLEETGFSEIQLITHKYKYLVDIIAERINRYNNETYKSEHDALTGCYNRLRLDRSKI